MNLSLQKYTFCKYWTKIVGQSWFGARIYTRGLTLGGWPLNSEIKISSYSFSLVLYKNFYPNQTNGSKNNWGWPTDRRLTTDDRQTFLSWPPIHKGNFNFFFCVYGRERMNGVKLIPPCLLRKFALLTCSACRGIRFQLPTKMMILFYNYFCTIIILLF